MENIVRTRKRDKLEIRDTHIGRERGRREKGRGRKGERERERERERETNKMRDSNGERDAGI